VQLEQLVRKVLLAQQGLRVPRVQLAPLEQPDLKVHKEFKVSRVQRV
jgi:hypothetical protein